MVGPENTHVSDIMDSEQIIFRNMYVYKYMHTLTINERRGYEYDTEQGGVYVRVWKEEMKRRKDVVTLCPQK